MSELGFMGEFDPDGEDQSDSPDGVRKDEVKKTGESARADQPEQGNGKLPAGEESVKSEVSFAPGGKAEKGNGAADKQGSLFDFKVDDSPPEPGAQAAKSSESGDDLEGGGDSHEALSDGEDGDWLYNPTSLEMLRSHEGTDIPKASPFGYVSGARHPELADLDRYSQLVEAGSLWLPGVTPLLNAPGQTPLDRVPYYGRQLSLQCQDRSTHVLVLGKTGAGKNTRILDLLRFSALQDPNQTVISVSLKASDYGPIKAACDQVGKKCLVVNFDNDRRSQGFNPLRWASKNEAPDIIRRLADSSRNPRSSDSEFWTQMLRTGMMALYEGGYRSFPEMFRFFTRGRKTMLRGLEGIKSVNAEKLRDFLSGGSWNAETTEATIVGAFVAFQQDSVQRVMSLDELRLDKLFQEPVCLHIEVNEATLETVLPLVQMLLRTVVDQLIKTAQRRGREAIPATLFIDDMPSLGPVFSVERLLTLRSRKVGLIAGSQSISALLQSYPHSGAAILEAFANQIVLPGCSPEDAEYFSRASGSQTVSLPAASGQTPQYMVQPMLSPADIRTPPYRHFLLGRPLTFLFGDVTFQAYVQYSFEVPGWRKILQATKGVTGTEPLRKRRLPNHFKARSPRMDDPDGERVRPLKVRFPIKFNQSDVQGWTEVDFRTAIYRGFKELDFDSAAVDVRLWWDRYLMHNKKCLWAVLKIVSDLVELDSNMTEFFEASDSSKSRDSYVALAYLRYKKLLDAANRREELNKGNKEGKKSDSKSKDSKKPADSTPPSFFVDPDPCVDDEEQDDTSIF
jgi:hypothetical protein